MVSKFNIEEYLDSLSDDVNVIDVSHKNFDYLPDLSRFKKLERLCCSFNNLMSLPVLPKNLRELYCSGNNLTSLPVLPKNLRELYCSGNNLTSLPNLPEKLEKLFCLSNNLTSLPNFPEKLKNWSFFGNSIFKIINNNDLNIIKKNIRIMNNFRYLYYCLKYRKIFLKMMEPIIKKRYHPSYLYNLEEEDDLDEKLDKW